MAHLSGALLTCPTLPQVGAHCVMIVGGDLSGPSFVVFDPWGSQGGEVSCNANLLRTYHLSTRPQTEEDREGYGNSIKLMFFVSVFFLPEKRELSWALLKSLHSI